MTSTERKIIDYLKETVEDAKENYYDAIETSDSVEEVARLRAKREVTDAILMDIQEMIWADTDAYEMTRAAKMLNEWILDELQTQKVDYQKWYNECRKIKSVPKTENFYYGQICAVTDAIETVKSNFHMMYEERGALK